VTTVQTLVCISCSENVICCIIIVSSSSSSTNFIEMQVLNKTPGLYVAKWDQFSVSSNSNIIRWFLCLTPAVLCYSVISLWHIIMILIYEKTATGAGIEDASCSIPVTVCKEVNTACRLLLSMPNIHTAQKLVLIVSSHTR